MVTLLRRRRARASGVEAVEDRGRAAGGQRAEEPGAQPVHVEQGEGQDEAVVGLPVPGDAQRLHPRQQRAMGVDGTFGLTGGARGVDDQARRPRAGPHSRRTPARAPARRAASSSAGDDTAQRRIDLRQPLPGRRAVDQGGRRADVALQIGQFALCRRRIDGDDDGPEAQRPQEAHNGVQRRRTAPQDPVPRLDPPIGQVRRRQGGPFRQGAGPQEHRRIAPVHQDRPIRIVVPVGRPHPEERASLDQIGRRGSREPRPARGPPHAMVRPHAIVWRT